MYIKNKRCSHDEEIFSICSFFNKYMLCLAQENSSFRCCNGLNLSLAMADG